MIIRNVNSIIPEGTLLITVHDDKEPEVVFIKQDNDTSKNNDCQDCEKDLSFMDKAHGLLGIVKSGLGVDAAPVEKQELRKSTCLNCPTKQYDGFGGCNKCGCWLKAKITINGEKCPDGHW